MSANSFEHLAIRLPAHIIAKFVAREITATELRILTLVNSIDDVYWGMSNEEIANLIGSTPSRVQDILDSMENRNLLCVRWLHFLDPHPHRERMLRLTFRGYAEPNDDDPDFTCDYRRKPGEYE